MTETPGELHSTTQEHAESTAGGGRLLKWFSVLFLVFLLLGVYAFTQRRSEHRVLAEQTEQMAVVNVAVIHPTPLTGQSDLVLPGNIQPYIESPIYARTNGYLKTWYKDIGAHVKKGELLAVIDAPELDQQLAQAKADLVTAQANVKLADVTAARYQGLLKSDAVSQQEVDNFTSDFAAKQAMVKSAEANVDRLQALESFKNVYAPFDGVITQRNIDVGWLINAGNGGTSVKEMFDMAQTDPLRVYVSVPQTYAPAMQAGLKACLQLNEFPGRSFCGQVVRTSDAVDPNTRTLNTEVDVPNPTGTLLQGEYAQVHFDVKGASNRLSVPINALLFRPEGTMVATVGSNNKLLLKKLSTGRDLGDSVEVLEGISPADAIVINPPDALENGQQVNVTGGSSQPASASPPVE